MKAKSFKIGEYALGGIVKVTPKNGEIIIQALDWTTKVEVDTRTFSEFDKSGMMEYLEAEITSYFHAERIIKWIFNK